MKTCDSCSFSHLYGFNPGRFFETSRRRRVRRFQNANERFESLRSISLASNIAENGISKGNNRYGNNLKNIFQQFSFNANTTLWRKSWPRR